MFCNPIKTFICLLLCGMLSHAHAQEISLAGPWRFQTDKEDKGISEAWFLKELPGTVRLPGSMTENGLGDDVTLHTKWTGSIYDSSFFFRASLARYREEGQLKIPFWLTPLKHYTGVAWYQKSITIPANWQGKNRQLFLERAHTQTTVWIDNTIIGKGNSLVAPHQFNIPPHISAGKHVLTVRIDNRLDQMNVGPDSHSVTDHTQGNWNGLTGKLALQATPALHMADIQVYPDLAAQQARVVITTVNNNSAAIQGRIVLQAASKNTARKHTTAQVTVDVTAKPNDTTFTEAILPMGNSFLPWDEFSPALYTLSVSLNAATGEQKQEVRFGMREVKVTGQSILVNGNKIYLRGDVNNCEFPLTGYAPMDVAAWRKLFAVAKSHGLNHMRFHSWCPPEAAFAAADEAGFYLQPEGPSWPNHGTSLGDNRFIDQYLYEETARILKAYGNHPSFCMFAAGNEPAGRNQVKYLQQFVTHWRKQDNRRVYAAAAVGMSWPLYSDADYMIKSGPRGLNWQTIAPETVSDYQEKIKTFTIPYVTHEMGQWCVFPDFSEIKKYTGITRARNFELFQSELQAHDMGDRAKDFLMASGKLQALCYKQEIEKSLRTPNGAGFQLLGLQDFPGQGTALIGVINAFWQEKGYLTAKEWSRFCNVTVPLTRIAKFTYSNNETFVTPVEICHYGPQDLTNAVVSWRITDEGNAVLQKGTLPATTIRKGGNTFVDSIRFSTADIKKAARLKLTVSVNNTAAENDWHFWVYPEVAPVTGNVHYTDTIDAKTMAVLEQGGTVFLHAAGKVVKGKEIVQHFTPVFWNTSWFKMRPPHTLGITLDPAHPAFKYFPTAYHSDLQWWEIVNQAQVMHLEDFPKGFRPLVQPIDTWFMNRKLALIMEANVGKGKMIISSADLTSMPDKRLAARQLLYSLQQYMASAAFKPAGTVDLAVVKDLFVSPSKERWENFTKQNPDELKPQQITK
ncbi:beta-glucuronidase [Chitinophaga sp. B61]|uniref:beta-galactosidase n=2 Tax=Chitinophaga rhizophila TaxID=2866212 RepID=A0ABS7GJJ8_9BACT|nr:beta-glucuronidase [Chitinophaga rhizophila]